LGADHVKNVTERHKELDKVHELDVKEIEKDLGDNFAPVLRSSKKKGENLMSWWDK